MVRKYGWPFMVAVFLLAGCGRGQEDAGEETEENSSDSAEVVEEDTLQLLPPEIVPVAADQNFDDFFYSFVTDEAFQKERVEFPLQSTNPEGESLTREAWDAEKRFASQEIYCVLYDREQDFEIQKDTSLREVNVSWVNLTRGLYQTYRFFRRSVQWKLEDYSDGKLSQSRQADFLQFYSRFASDSLFQRESVVLPLRLVVEPEDGSEPIVTELSAEEWEEYRQELPMPSDVMTLIDYGQASLSENRKILMLQGLSSGFFITFKFDRTNERWRLYQIEN